MNLESAEPKNTDDLLSMMGDFFYMFQYPFDRETREEQIKKLFTQKDWGHLFIFREGDQDAGYLMLAFGYSFEFGGRIGFIDELYIKPDFRGKGLGKIILKQLKEKMEGIGLASLRLEVEQYNQQAIRLYESEGFEVHQTRHLMTFPGPSQK